MKFKTFLVRTSLYKDPIQELGAIYAGFE